MVKGAKGLSPSKSWFSPSWMHNVFRLLSTRNANVGFGFRSDLGVDSCITKFVRGLD